MVRELGSYVPLLSNQLAGGKTPSLTVRELEQIGYKIVIFPGVCVYTASVAIGETLKQLKRQGTDRDIVKKGSTNDVFTVVGIEDWLKRQEKYKSD